MNISNKIDKASYCQYRHCRYKRQQLSSLYCVLGAPLVMILQWVQDYEICCYLIVLQSVLPEIIGDISTTPVSMSWYPETNRHMSRTPVSVS
jgi:hypothetical protein